MNPPFNNDEEVLCIRNSPELNFDGTKNANCYCKKNFIYRVDFTMWSSKFGWMVC